jgi:hypothetical protein
LSAPRRRRELRKVPGGVAGEARRARLAQRLHSPITRARDERAEEKSARIDNHAGDREDHATSLVTSAPIIAFTRTKKRAEDRERVEAQAKRAGREDLARRGGGARRRGRRRFGQAGRVAACIHKHRPPAPAFDALAHRACAASSSSKRAARCARPAASVPRTPARPRPAPRVPPSTQTDEPIPASSSVSCPRVIAIQTSARSCASRSAPCSVRFELSTA